MDFASLGVLSSIFQLVWLLAALVALVFLLRIYARTRLSGFLWLLAAIVIGPFVSRIAVILMPFLMAGSRDAMAYSRFSIIVLGLLGLGDSVLLLIAAVVLDRQISATAVRLPEMPVYMSPPPAPRVPPYNG